MSDWQLQAAVLVRSKDEIPEILKKWDSFFKNPVLVLLQGPMAAGKTELVRNFAKLKGFEDVASPSFAIHHRYRRASRDQMEIDHFDLFRLSNEEELESTGFWDLIENKQAWIFIEWPERLSEDQISRRIKLLKIVFKMNPDDSRRLELYERNR